VTVWPAGMVVDPISTWPGALTVKRQASPFSSTMTATLTTLRRELVKLQATNVRLQVAIPAAQFRLDGFPRSTARAEHPGIILTMDAKVGALSYPCDTFTAWEGNLRAIALALEALRKVDRYGVTKSGEQYRGFLAIEGTTAAPAGFNSVDQALVFLAEVAHVGMAMLDETKQDPASLLRRAKRYAHPDTGGSAGLFQRVILAELYLANHTNGPTQ
jgi:hypothetical protein